MIKLKELINRTTNMLYQIHWVNYCDKLNLLADEYDLKSKYYKNKAFHCRTRSIQIWENYCKELDTIIRKHHNIL